MVRIKFKQVSQAEMKCNLYGYKVGGYYIAYGTLIKIIAIEEKKVRVLLVNRNEEVTFWVMAGWKPYTFPSNKEASNTLKTI